AVKCKSAVAAILISSVACTLSDDLAHRPNALQSAAAILLYQIFEAPLLYVDGKHLVVNQATSKLCGRSGMQDNVLETGDEILPDMFRHVVRLCRIDIAVQHQRPKQNLPVLPYQQ